jgi:hypothetical protein
MAKEKTKPQDASAARSSTAIQKAAMLVALEKSIGVVTTAAKAVGITRECHRLWMAKDPEYFKAVSELKDVRLDFLESQAHKRVQEGSDTMIIFLLKTQGKGRGYIERAEHIVETTDSLANRIDFDQAKRLLDSAGIATQVKDDALTSDE